MIYTVLQHTSRHSPITTFGYSLSDRPLIALTIYIINTAASVTTLLSIDFFPNKTFIVSDSILNFKYLVIR